MFPEGTTTNGRQLVSFRTGAFLAPVPVHPHVIKAPFLPGSASGGSGFTPKWV